MTLPTWPDPHVVRLRELYESGDSCSVIARTLNEQFPGYTYSRNAVIGKLHRLGIKSDRPKKLGRPASRPRAAKPRVKYTLVAPSITGVGAIIHLRNVAVEPLHISLLELTSENCHYPYGDEQFTFCGHPHAEGFPYCGPHAALTHKS